MKFHYYDSKKNDATLEVFDMPEDFLISFENFYKDIFERPKMGTSSGFVNYTIPGFSREEVNKIITKMKSEAGFSTETEPIKAAKNISLIQQLLSVFNS